MEKKRIKIVIAPDSFKGTMTSLTAGSIIQEEIEKGISNVKTIRFSIADGGEGTIDAFYENLNGEYVEDTFTSPNFTKKEFRYVKFNNSAVIEAGQCAGLLFTDSKNPMCTTSLGMGEQIDHAISTGVKKIYIALGGSATNDAGTGLLSALGVKFFDKDNKEFIPVGSTLKDIVRIDNTLLKEKIKDIKFTLLCDVLNPLYGENGAAYIYAKQKGASDSEVVILDEGLQYFSKIVKEQFEVDLSVIEGGGAAGGIGASCSFFLNAEIVHGIDLILDLCDFDNAIENTDLVITGEGKFDRQSMMGKTISGIARRTVKRNIPLVIFAGRKELEDDELKKEYLIQEIYEVASPNQTFDEIKKNCEEDLRKAVRIFLDKVIY
jgi:glycerate kinase